AAAAAVVERTGPGPKVEGRRLAGAGRLVGMAMPNTEQNVVEACTLERSFRLQPFPRVELEAVAAADRVRGGGRRGDPHLFVPGVAGRSEQKTACFQAVAAGQLEQVGEHVVAGGAADANTDGAPGRRGLRGLGRGGGGRGVRGGGGRGRGG